MELYKYFLIDNFLRKNDEGEILDSLLKTSKFSQLIMLHHIQVG